MERRKQNRRQSPSLTKQVLVRATRKASRKLASEAMRIKGYVVQAENGWVVKIDRHGIRTRISRINGRKIPRKVTLD